MGVCVRTEWDLIVLPERQGGVGGGEGDVGEEEGDLQGGEAGAPPAQLVPGHPVEEGSN